MKSALARAPVRICDIGGWTDTWFYPKGAVLNFCVDLYSYVRILENTSDVIRIHAENLEKNVEIRGNVFKYNNNLDLLKAALKRMKIKDGMDIFVRSDAPPGCGTGTSASIAVALIAALAEYSNRKLAPSKIAELAHKLEVEELKNESGVQDQYAAAFGGINFMEIDYPNVSLTKIVVKEKRIVELESQLILVYFGSRSSTEMHKAVIENYEKGDAKTLNAFDDLKKCAYEMKEAVNSGNFNDIGQVINNNWQAQKKLHALMVNPLIEKAEEIANDNGAIGFKCNGAGGGGSATILADIGNEYKLKKKLNDNGFTILPCKLSFTGVQSFKLN
jgi:D-glycero-alpha-D-manno-heptose-7-phosphate kinase